MTADDFYSGTVSAVFGGTTTVLAFAAQHRGESLRKAVDDYMALAVPKVVIDFGFHLIVSDPTDTVLHAELPALAEHHERLDGTGYPLGLKGDQISLMGRIVAAADVFDAMTSDRPYRAAMPVEEVLDYLYQGVNLHYDGTCVQALTTAYVKGSIRTQKEREMLGLQ